ncbi:MAG: transcription initiation factor IIB family protein [Candidatus Heimdallarchaeota archaeon]
MDFCSSCQSSSIMIDSHRGEAICTVCGVVVEESLMRSEPEWRAYTFEERQSRARTGPVLKIAAPNGLATTFSGSAKDAIGNPISSQKQREMHRLAKTSMRTQDNNIRNMKTAFRELRRLCSAMGLPDDILEVAALYYRLALKKDLVRGRSIDNLVAACAYLACRHRRLSISIKDVEKASPRKRREISHNVRLLITELNIKPTPTDFGVLINRVGDDLDLTMHTRLRARKIVDAVVEAKLATGKNPLNLVAACIYIAAMQTGERRTQQQVAKVSKTTPVTIRNRAREILAKVSEIGDIKIKRGAAALPVEKSFSDFLRDSEILQEP